MSYGNKLEHVILFVVHSELYVKMSNNEEVEQANCILFIVKDSERVVNISAVFLSFANRLFNHYVYKIPHRNICFV